MLLLSVAICFSGLPEMSVSLSTTPLRMTKMPS
jgi:hypothetical protein